MLTKWYRTRMGLTAAASTGAKARPFARSGGLRGTRIVALNPSGSSRLSTEPPIPAATTPRRTRFTQPFDQWITTRSSSISQSTCTRSSPRESAPYLSAFVANSCRLSPTGVTCARQFDRSPTISIGPHRNCDTASSPLRPKCADPTNRNRSHPRTAKRGAPPPALRRGAGSSPTALRLRRLPSGQHDRRQHGEQTVGTMAQFVGDAGVFDDGFARRGSSVSHWDPKKYSARLRRCRSGRYGPRSRTPAVLAIIQHVDHGIDLFLDRFPQASNGGRQRVSP